VRDSACPISTKDGWGGGGAACDIPLFRPQEELRRAEQLRAALAARARQAGGFDVDAFLTEAAKSAAELVRLRPDPYRTGPAAGGRAGARA